MLKFRALYKQQGLLIGNPDSNVILCVSDLDEEMVSDYIDNCAMIFSFKFAARDLDLLVRNLLWNPQIRFVVVKSQTMESEVVQVLTKFFQDGVSRQSNSIESYWYVKDTQGCIDNEVTSEAIEQVRTNVVLQCIDDSVASEIHLFLQLYNQQDSESYSDERIFFTKSSTVARIVPSEGNGFVVRARHIADAWLKNLCISKLGTNTNVEFARYQVLDTLTSVIAAIDPTCWDIPSYVPMSKNSIQQSVAWMLTKKNFAAVETLASYIVAQNKLGIIHKLVECDLMHNGEHSSGYIWGQIKDKRLFISMSVPAQELYEQFFINAFVLRHFQERLRKSLQSSMRQSLYFGDLTIIAQVAYIDVTYCSTANQLIDVHMNDIIKRENKVISARGNFNVSVEHKTGHVVIEHSMPRVKTMISISKAKKMEPLLRSLLIEGAISSLESFRLGCEIQKAIIELEKDTKESGSIGQSGLLIRRRSS